MSDEWPGTPVGEQWPGQPVSSAPQGQWEQFKAGLGAIAQNPSLLLNVGPARMARELPGAVADAATLPGDVYQGRVDPTSDEGIRRAFNLATVASPINPAVGAGDRAIPGVAKTLQPQKPPAPTADALKGSAGAGYDAARGMGVDYKSTAVKDAAEGIQRGLEADGVLAELAPKSFAIVKKLQTPPPDSVAPLAGLEAARRALGHAARDFTNPTEQLAARRAIDGLDAFIAEGASVPSSPAVVAGPAAAAGRAMEDARGNYAAAMRSNKLHGIEDTAELRAGAANSGQNLDNAIRSRVASLVTQPKQVSGFTPEEIAQLKKVVSGSVAANTARKVGNLLGGGGGLAAALMASMGGAAGFHAGGVPGAGLVGVGLPATGWAAKKLANALTSRSLNKADEMTRMRSPLYQQAVNDAPMVPLLGPQENAAAYARALMLAGPPQN